MSLLFLALLAPPSPPAPRDAGPADCYTLDLREGAPVTLDCDGLVLGRARALSALEATDYSRQLLEAWPTAPEPVPWYDRPGWARLEGGLVVAGVVALTVAGLRAGQ